MGLATQRGFGLDVWFRLLLVGTLLLWRLLVRLFRRSIVLVVLLIRVC